MTATAVAIFMIVFLWTPPHFWAVALLLDEDYGRAGVPMLPTVRGARVATQQILVYTVLLVVSTFAPVALGTLGWFYAAAARVLGARFIWLAMLPPAGARRPHCRPADVPLLAALPRAAVRRHGDRQPALRAVRRRGARAR